jgi:hypothetical protein
LTVNSFELWWQTGLGFYAQKTGFKNYKNYFKLLIFNAMPIIDERGMQLPSLLIVPMIVLQ